MLVFDLFIAMSEVTSELTVLRTRFEETLEDQYKKTYRFKLESIGNSAQVKSPKYFDPTGAFTTST